MKPKIVLATIGVGFLLAALWGIYCAKNYAEESNSQGRSTKLFIKVVTVDEVVKAPEEYQGYMGVEGTVIKRDEPKDILLLGCEDACILMPVTYKGQVPEVKSKIIVYGELKKQEAGRYIFQGKEVKTK